jgi:hypothetical protein
MQYKADWPEAQYRLTALWHGERLDRPCMAVMAPQPTMRPLAVPEPADDEARWLDPEYLLPAFRHKLETTWWGGEAAPSCLTMANWMACLGGTPQFAPDTIWFATQEVDFSRPSPFRHDPDSPWMHRYRTLLRALCAMAAEDNFLLGQPVGLPASDLLSMHMGTEAFMLGLMDHPEWMAEAVVTGARDQAQVQHELQAFMREAGHHYWYGNAGWMRFWAPEPFKVTQSDVSCMLSPEQFDQFVLPELEVYAEAFSALWYHLDGGDARQHLPRLLSLPYLRVIQYIPTPSEPPNGPAHLEMYQHIQAAGKIVHIDVPLSNVEPLVRSLDPALLMLQVWCASRDEGEQLLDHCVKWTSQLYTQGVV